MGILEILRVPIQSKRDSVVILVTDQGEARCYYQGGKLVKATDGVKHGIAVINQIKSWEQGEFEVRDLDESVVQIDGAVNDYLLVIIKNFYAEKVSAQKKVAVGGGGPAPAAPSNLVDFPAKKPAPEPLGAGQGLARFTPAGDTISKLGAFTDADAAAAAKASDLLTALGKELGLGKLKLVELRGPQRRLGIESSGDNWNGAVTPADGDVRSLLAKVKK